MSKFLILRFWRRRNICRFWFWWWWYISWFRRWGRWYISWFRRGRRWYICWFWRRVWRRGRMRRLIVLVRVWEYGEYIFWRHVRFNGGWIVRCSFICNWCFVAIVIRNVTNYLDTSIGKCRSIFSLCDLTTSFFIPWEVGATVIILYSICKGIGFWLK